MKKTVLSALLILVLLPAINAQVRFGPEVGLNLSSYPIKTSSGFSISTSIRAGVRLGGIADVPLSDNFYLQPGLLYVMNGAKYSAFGGSVTNSVNTIQVPVNVLYKLGAPGRERLFFGAGPYFAYNISANQKANGQSQKLSIGNDANHDDLKPFDIGLGLNVGYEFNYNWLLRVHYQHGLVNLAPGGDKNNSVKNYNMGISVGYLFGGKHHEKDVLKEKKHK